MKNPLTGVLKEIAQQRSAAKRKKKEQYNLLVAKEKKEVVRVLKTLRERILEAARDGLSGVYVMKCLGGNGGPSTLTKAARRLYDACIEAKLNVRLSPESVGAQQYTGMYVTFN